MLGYLLALLIGLSLGILGGGGSMLTVPILVYVMGFPAKQAIAMSLPVVGATSLIGALRHWRAGTFDLRTALLFGVVAMTGARVGAAVASRVSGVLQLSILGAMMLVAAVMMLRSRPTEEPPARDMRRAGSYSPSALAAIAAVGFGVGILTGLVGIGGGFLFVPALVLFGRLPMKTAVGTSLLVIAMSTAAGFVGYRGQVAVPWRVVAIFTAVAVVGLLLGTQFGRKLSAQALRRLFAYFLFLMAAFILYQNRGVLAHPGAALRPSSAGTH